MRFENGGIAGGSALFGGAIIAHDSLIIKDCVFENNTATLGGAIALNRDNGDLVATKCSFLANLAEGLDGGAHLS